MTATGSIAVTTSKLSGSGGVQKTSIVWTSDASAGSVTGNTLAMRPGSIVLVEFIPGTGGVQPTDAYDVDFLDDNGTSMFDDGSGTSIGANLSQTNSTHKIPFITGYVSLAATSTSTTYVRTWLHGGSAYQPTVANAGNSKQGTINIYQVPNVL